MQTNIPSDEQIAALAATVRDILTLTQRLDPVEFSDAQIAADVQTLFGGDEINWSATHG